MTRQRAEHAFRVDAAGNPTGGYSVGPGYSITWQDGIEDERGATCEDLIEAITQRLLFFQASKFACPENEDAVKYLNGAKWALEDRTRGRRLRGVEGTY